LFAAHRDRKVRASLLRLIDRLANKVGAQLIDRASSSLPLIGRPFDSFNIIDVAFFRAAKESAAYWCENMITATAFGSASDLLAHALRLVTREGLFLEFGVATGQTISQIAELSQAHVFGFDSFEGLPEPWRTGFPKGCFSGEIPRVPANVSIVEGWFSETLPKFTQEHDEPVAFLHVDCDLYSSTKCIFDLLHPRIGPGCVIVFDEYFNYPGWQNHEHKAFMELVDRHQLRFRYDAFVPDHQQVCVVIQ
jgi:methyltransferase family protein